MPAGQTRASFDATSRRSSSKAHQLLREYRQSTHKPTIKTPFNMSDCAYNNNGGGGHGGVSSAGATSLRIQHLPRRIDLVEDSYVHMLRAVPEVDQTIDLIEYTEVEVAGEAKRKGKETREEKKEDMKKKWDNRGFFEHTNFFALRDEII
ncbi:unnamed protein product [Fusarium equiseti]|uniref:Uncharacterized protein n=1 Tax=Fusarium equiseti TaxID=61235 RepID=A0A8J2IRJ4_FUSEQ|nr:unnamed protein product [Fusarium equiseti]